MRRRSILGRLLGLVGVASAGCIRRGRVSNFERFRNRLRASPLHRRCVAADARRWVVEYYPARDESAFLAEDRAVATAYAETVSTDSERRGHRLLECLLLGDDDHRIGRYEIDAAWARARADGTLSAEAYADRVTGAIEMRGRRG